jgi:hypothetical protein
MLKGILFLLVSIGFVVGDIPTIDGLFASSMQTTFQNGEPWLRQAHPKQHGCVQGQLFVESNIPNSLQIGS